MNYDIMSEKGYLCDMHSMIQIENDKRRRHQTVELPDQLINHSKSYQTNKQINKPTKYPTTQPAYLIIQL